MTFALVIQCGLEKSGKACVYRRGMSYSLDVCGVCVLCTHTHMGTHKDIYNWGR